MQKNLKIPSNFQVLYSSNKKAVKFGTKTVYKNIKKHSRTHPLSKYSKKKLKSGNAAKHVLERFVKLIYTTSFLILTQLLLIYHQ